MRWSPSSIYTTLSRDYTLWFAQIHYTFSLVNIYPSIRYHVSKDEHSFTMKWHFSLFSMMLTFTHRSNTFSKLTKQILKFDPHTGKSSMKTSMISSRKSTKIASMHIWKVAGSLHSSNGILQWGNVLLRHEKVVFSWSSGWTVIWMNPKQACDQWTRREKDPSSWLSITENSKTSNAC